ncbi:ABC transporter permease [Candidatus Sumerlaeota bacterium]|nr:ABC transporter permease [Candidatus Sumerlaeota bacterium]
MILGNVIRVALRSLFANKLRMALTMLGIIIGVGAVIAMLALGTGAREAAVARFEAMGTNLLTLRNQWGRARRQFLSIQEWHVIEGYTQYVEMVAPEAFSSVRVRAGSNNQDGRISGTTPEYFIVRNVEVEFGRPFDQLEYLQNADVCVIGSQVAEDLFGGQDPINQSIYAGTRRLRVIGVARAKGEGWQSPDEWIFAPLGTVMNRIIGQDYLDNIHIRCRSYGIIPEAQAALTDLMRRTRGLTPDEEDNFRFFSPTEIIEEIKQSVAIFQALLGGVAALSLLVGGIGIMNIMLVTVTERTREIGIRKALGARRRDILVQFLIESIVVSVAGGALGILLGWGIASALDHFVEQFDTMITAGSIILAVTCSTAIGLIFGIYPARSAAQLDPIEALRHE